LPASKERINKAGDVLRLAAEQRQWPNDDHREALALVRAYRAAHSYPLTAVTAGLRHHARKAAGDSRLDLSQRLKQLATITDKLVRMPKSRLARMQDIGGGRRSSTRARSMRQLRPSKTEHGAVTHGRLWTSMTT
jgi:putative GTP pyrophosphokinase